MNRKWIDPAVVPAVHDEQLAEHGGMRDLKDMGLLQSAPARVILFARPGNGEIQQEEPASWLRKHFDKREKTS